MHFFFWISNHIINGKPTAPINFLSLKNTYSKQLQIFLKINQLNLIRITLHTIISIILLTNFIKIIQIQNHFKFIKINLKSL